MRIGFRLILFLPGLVLSEGVAPSYQASPRSPSVFILRSSNKELEQVETFFLQRFRGRYLGTRILKKGKLPHSLPPLPRDTWVLSLGGRSAFLAAKTYPRNPRVVAGTLGLSPRVFPGVRGFFPLDFGPTELLERVEALCRCRPRTLLLLSRKRWASLARSKEWTLFLKKHREVLVQVSDHPSSSIRILEKEKRPVELVLLLPDPQTTPFPASRLSNEFEREMERKGVFTIGFRKGHFRSRAIAYLRINPPSIAKAVLAVFQPKASLPRRGPLGFYDLVSNPKLLSLLPRRRR